MIYHLPVNPQIADVIVPHGANHYHLDLKPEIYFCGKKKCCKKYKKSEKKRCDSCPGRKN